MLPRLFLIAVVTNTDQASVHTCMSYGPNYYRTLDGLEFMFAGRCTYTAYQDTFRSVVVTMKDCERYQTCGKVRPTNLNNVTAFLYPDK